MKQQLTAALLALTCLLPLSACAGGHTNADADPTGYTVEALTLMDDAGAFSEELETLDGDTAFLLYGLGDHGMERDALTECAVLRSAGATCEEGAVLVFQTEEQAKQAEQALLAYLQHQIDSNASYRPAEVPKLEDAAVSQLGSTVLMVVANDMAAANQAVPYMTVN